MAAGPFVGAALLGAIHAESALASAGFVLGGPVDFLTPSWRWVFYVNVPIGIVALVFAWAASAGWARATRLASTCSGRRRSLSGWSSVLIGLTLLGSAAAPTIAGVGSPTVIRDSSGGGLVGLELTVVDDLVRRDRLLDVRLFRRREFTPQAAH